ncbi:MAG: FeoA family protein [Pelosinus sp.]|nr:FeoA family protein [Pelosinus sp.]
MVQLISIVRCKQGDIVRVVRLLLTGGEHLRKLTAFGILPGARIVILQTCPAYVLKVGCTEIALDYEIAKNIIVTNKEDSIL